MKCIRKLFSVIQNGRWQPFCKNLKKNQKLRIDLKWREMRSKAIFGPKWPQAFCGNKKLRIDLKWREMRSKVIFGHPKWPAAAKNAIESDFRSSKMTCKPFGDIHSICPWANTPILVTL